MNSGVDLGAQPSITGSPGQQTAVMYAVTLLINECITTRHIPACMKVGWVTLVPKPKADGSFSPDPDKMRPITVLPVLGRLVSKVMATRLGDILTNHPTLLTPAQRAFIRDGAHSQCVDTVLDVFEDHRQTTGQGRGRKSKPLYAVSYDQKKAYDSVQQYTVEATLTRFNLPEAFIELVLSSMTEATSCVRTAGGLTKPFTRQSSLTQGDPLAPIIYSLITDALHEGLRDCPLPQMNVQSKQWGYTMCGGPRVCSAGFADDSLIMADSADKIRGMHAWVRAFFGAHGFGMNVVKTRFMCSDFDSDHPERSPILPSVDGGTMIEPEGPGAVFRYLGILMSLDLSWGEQIAVMKAKVRNVCASIRSNRLHLLASAHVIKQYLLPCLRGGLLVVAFPNRKTQLSEWDDLISRSMWVAAGVTHPPNAAPMQVALNVPTMIDHQVNLRGSELAIRINSAGTAQETCAARWQSGTAVGGKYFTRHRATAAWLESDMALLNVDDGGLGADTEVNVGSEIVAPPEISESELLHRSRAYWNPLLETICEFDCGGGGETVRPPLSGNMWMLLPMALRFLAPLDSLEGAGLCYSRAPPVQKRSRGR